MAKDFKSIDELIGLLESRNVTTDGDTRGQLMRESYYAIVNGYKGPFLDTAAMASSSGDVYVKGTRFEWIYTLFSFDRDLRAVALKYLVRAEAVMKSAVVYSFCESNREPDAYLDVSSYVDAGNMLVPKGFRGNRRQLHRDNLAELMRILNSKVGRKSNKPYIRHYVDTHGSVPLWVLANDLTFGHVSHFYQLQKRGVQNASCRMIAVSSGRKSGKQSDLTPQMLLRAFSVLVDFRNICAHDERLYCAKVGKSHDMGFYDMAAHLFLILPRDAARAFLDEVFALFEKYGKSLHVVTPHSLLKDMGFDVEDGR